MCSVPFLAVTCHLGGPPQARDLTAPHCRATPLLPWHSFLPSEADWPAAWQRQKELHMARVAADRAAKKVAVRYSCCTDLMHPS